MFVIFMMVTLFCVILNLQMNFDKILCGNYTLQNNCSSIFKDNESQPNPHPQHNSIVSITNLEMLTNIDTDESSNEQFPYKSFTLHKRAHKEFIYSFIQNRFGYDCMVCDRLWFEGDLKKVDEKNLEILRQIPVKKYYE